jgi:predicted Zn-dependent protease
MIEELLERSGADHVELLEERQELLRFGGSRITYQHSEERVTVRARRGRERHRDATADADTLRERLGTGARGTVAPPVEAPARGVETAFRATEAANAAERVQLYRSYLTELPGGAALGGSIAHSIVDHSVANIAGVVRAERRTRALVQLVASEAGRSSYARALHRDAARLPRLSAVADGLAPLPTRALEPGRYRALLEPQAMAVLAATLAQVGFHPVDGAFAGRLGQRLLGENVSLCDDGCDADGLPTTFDCEGTPKQRVALVERGVVQELIREETGHAVPPGWRFGAGPNPSHVFLAAGGADDAALRASCDTGLRIQRVDYVRVVQPKQTLVTGSSRDATLWLEGGRAVARVPQFRFTVRLDELFSSLESIGARRERGETPFMESVVAPAAVASSFPVDFVTG